MALHLETLLSTSLQIDSLVSLSKKLLRWDILMKGGWSGPNCCALCKTESETISHIFIFFQSLGLGFCEMSNFEKILLDPSHYVFDFWVSKCETSASVLIISHTYCLEKSNKKHSGMNLEVSYRYLYLTHKRAWNSLAQVFNPSSAGWKNLSLEDCTGNGKRTVMFKASRHSLLFLCITVGGLVIRLPSTINIFLLRSQAESSSWDHKQSHREDC